MLTIILRIKKELIVKRTSSINDNKCKSRSQVKKSRYLLFRLHIFILLDELRLWNKKLAAICNYKSPSRDLSLMIFISFVCNGSMKMVE